MNLRRLREGESSQVEGREENPRKKFKELKVELVQLDDVDKLPQIKKGRCNICRQYLEDVPYYNGHPNKSVPECTTLVDDRLSLFTGSESNLHQHDVRPSHKITHFSVYDKNGHLCPFDTGLIEGNKLLYFSGYVKPIYTEDTSTTNAIPTMEMGPINEWFTAGFDGGAKALVGFCTPYADYILQEPSIEYKPIFNMAKQKIYIAKIVIEFLANERWQNPTYEDLLQRLQATGNPELTEDALLRHAQFICDQVSSYDLAADDDEYLLITAPCMRALVKMAGVTFLKRKKLVKLDNNIVKKTTWSKATTTTLVHEVFETIFMDEIEKQNQDEKGPRRKRCGTCEACQIPDCGSCVHCRDMLKYGGTGTHKQACKMRRCPNMAIEDANAESDAEDDDSVDEKMADAKPQPCLTRITHDVKWIGEPIIEYEDRIYYNAAQVGDMTLTSCDYVMLYSAKPNQPLVIAEIQYMWEDATKGSMFHANLLRRGADTVLGETSDPRELFIVDICENCPLGSIVHKAKVEKRKLAKNWALNGGLDRLPPQLEDDGQTFFYSKRYNAECSRFEDIVERPTASSLDYGPCDGCRRRMEKKNLKTPVLEDGNVKWFNEVYRKGSGVFLEPNTFTNKNFSSIEQSVEKENIDAQLYPEFYRKRIHNQKGSNFDTPEPFEIGLIEEIIETSRKVITLKVRKFYRPEHTQSNVPGTYDKDLNLLYWSDKEYEVNFNKVKGKCYIAFGDGLQTSPRAWSEEGPYRFYFTEGYNHKTRKYYDVPLQATRIGVAGKGKGVGKGKSKKRNKLVHDLPPQWIKVKSPLNCMDVFAGCGGLSEGLHQSGVAATKWAIEKDPAAARAFELNNPQCNVYTGDCNDLLRIVMSGEQKNALPQKGEVEMLVGGPPCQGFSGMNRFNAGQYSNFKNSLIVSYLSYCDYYRPRYFILENVRNFVSFKRNMILKLTLRCLLAIGYQVTFGVLQAGHYGIAQTRRRLIIMAAAPGYALPNYPEPQHVFNKKGCQLSVPVDNYKYQTGLRWSSSAPYRTITVRDAMSDLPKITNGCDIKGMPYPSEAMSHFQRIMRHDDDPTGVLRDHICKEMAPIVEARITHIPVYPGSDWRDLPNIVVRLTDGYYTNKLKYRYRTSKAKKGDHPRGVCSCVTTNKCEPADRQFNTLIPWCLPHTADRHNHWAGLYGRLAWDGYFSTTITNPEPMGKQGRVLHPEQHRVVSVRECARSQGFPDRYCFYGSILDKHRQVGNAVPPPLGEALGKELQKAAIMGKLD